MPCLLRTVWQMLADDIQQIVNTTWSIEVDCGALCRVICLSDLLYFVYIGGIAWEFPLLLSLCSLPLFCLPTCVRALSKNLANAAYEQCAAVHTPRSEHVYDCLSMCMFVCVWAAC